MTNDTINLPCDSCIVSSMCRDYCDDLVVYLSDNTERFERLFSYVYIAVSLRNGNAKVHGKAVRRTLDGLAMCELFS